MIPQETIDQVIHQTDIVELISSYFPLKRAGSEFVALCPFHNEKSPSFSVSPAKQMYYCFGCGEGGGAARFLVQYENVDFVTAVRRLAERVGVPIIEEAPDPKTARRKQRRQRLLEVHFEVTEWFHRQLLRTDAAQKARDYLKRRGLGIEIARDWRLGYAPEPSGLLFRWAEEKGFDRSLLIEAGLASERDGGRVVSRFRDRLMFPICNDLGEVIAFSGRTLDSEAPMAKYVNSPETELFHKSKTFFGFHRSKRPILKAGSAIVCEGQIDMITCFSHGVENIVASLGTAFTEEHARILKRHTDEVILCFDADSAGFKAALKSFQVLTKANIYVKAVNMPSGEDPDSLVRSKGVEAFRDRVNEAQDFFDFHLQRRASTEDIGSPRVQREVALELAENVALVTDKLMQDTVINSVSARLGVSNEQFRQSVQAAQQKARRYGKKPSANASVDSESAREPLGFHDPSAKLLCQMLLIDRDAKAWFRALDEPELILENIEDAEFINIINHGTFDPDKSSEVARFLSGLSKEQESLFTWLILTAPVGDHFRAAQDAWRKLELEVIQNQKAVMEGRLKDRSLSAEESFPYLIEISRLKEKLDRLTRRSDSAALSTKNSHS